MIKLIILEGDTPVFNPEVRMIAVFRKIIERDKGKKSEREMFEVGDNDGRLKRIATKELAFIYFYCDPRSSFVESYTDEDIREEKVKTILELPDKWKKDSLIDEAIKFYLTEIQNDFDYMYLNAGINAAEKTRKYLEGVDYGLRDNKGNLLYKPIEVAKTIKESGGIIESLKLLREKVFKKASLTVTPRGGGELGMFERPE